VVYRFGEFTLDQDIRQLSLGQTEVHLSPKAFDLLVALVANRSRALSKAELQEQLWPSTFVEETNLASLVAEIRRALHDSASSPAFVRTVYGFGYRFVGDVAVDRPAARSGSSRTKRCVVWEGRELILMEGVNVVGRDPDVTIQIDARGVSRRHAQIVVSANDAILQDLNSKNGSYVNGQRIATAIGLADGDEVGLGAVRVTFRVTSAVSQTETLPAHASASGQPRE
jgi:DNA-binding winged helix-turn-helix (wHTH) protein